MIQSRTGPDDAASTSSTMATTVAAPATSLRSIRHPTTRHPEQFAASSSDLVRVSGDRQSRSIAVTNGPPRPNLVTAMRRDTV